jgi:hypothetical protein
MLMVGQATISHASLISQSQELVFNGSVSSWSDSFLINKFDNNLGSLNSVNYNLTVNFTPVYMGIENTSSTVIALTRASIGTFTYLNSFDSLNNLVSIYSSSPKLTNLNYGLSAYDRITDYKGSSGFSYIYNSGSISASNSSSDSSANNLANFIGNGTKNLPLTGGAYVSYSYSGSPASTSTLALVSGVNAKLDVTYDYTPTPIPPAFLLMGSGIVGLFGMRKRLQQQVA